jgi:N6-adenosine-specific RNA methylase IME4
VPALAKIDVPPPADPFLAERTVDQSNARLEAIVMEIETLQATAILQVAARLAEARDIFRYQRDEGGFTGWVERRLSFGKSTAYKLLDVHERFGVGESFHIVETLPRSVLYLLAAPGTPEPARAEVIERTEAGESLAHADVKAIINAHGERPILQAASEIRARNIEERRAERLARIAAQCDPGPLPKGPWPILFVDPAWRYDFSATSSRAIERHYETMSLEEICALPVGEIAAENAALFLCVPQAINEQAFAVIKAWGFQYCSGAVWEKTDGIGEGFYFRSQHELFLLATRGDFPPPPPALRLPSVIKAPRGAHSEKPAALYEAVERMYPRLARIELFCRGRPRPGWAGWGNEALPDPAAPDPPPPPEAAPAPQPAAKPVREAPPGADLSSADDGIPPLLRRPRTKAAP